MEKGIDLVIPMVFPADPVWRQEHYRHKGGDARQHVRYRSWGTEELLIKCCLKYMPWLNCIHVLLASESQVQGWMEDYTVQSSQFTVHSSGTKVKIHFHEDFMPKEYLPCFASPCIEMFLHRIPGLSEHFIYANDDMFPLSPLEPTDFFRPAPEAQVQDASLVQESSNASLVQGENLKHLWPCQRITDREYPENPGTFMRKCMWQQNMIARPFGKRFTKTVPETGHIFSAILKSSCEEVWRRHGEEITRYLSPLRRTDHSANNWIYQLYQQYSGQYIDHRPTRHYTDQTTPIAEIVKIIRSDDAGIVCLNDNEHIADWRERARIVRETISEKLEEL